MGLSSPRNPRKCMGSDLGSGAEQKGAHARCAAGMCLEEGAAVYDEYEQARLREVELPRVRLDILDRHVGQNDGVL